MQEKNPSRSMVIRVAVQSALAAGLCLGFPAGLLLWLILIQDAYPAASLEGPVVFLQAHGFNKIMVLMVCSFGWGYLLGRISRYRHWWKIGLATAIGILAGWFSPLSNLDAWFADGLPIHSLYALTMCGIVFSATLCVGLAYGLLLRSLRAALTISLTTSVASVCTLLLTIFIFDRFGIRVGGAVHLAMSRVTTVSLLASALAGGAVLGAGFTWFLDRTGSGRELHGE